MRTTLLLATLAVAVAVTCLTGWLFFAVADARSASSFFLWCSAPFLGFVGLAVAAARCRHRTSAIMVLVVTILAGLASSFVYWVDVSPVLDAQARGVPQPDCHCAGPLFELGLPIRQWGLAFLLAGIVVPLMVCWRSRNEAAERAGHLWDSQGAWASLAPTDRGDFEPGGNRPSRNVQGARDAIRNPHKQA